MPAFLAIELIKRDADALPLASLLLFESFLFLLPELLFDFLPKTAVAGFVIRIYLLLSADATVIKCYGMSFYPFNVALNKSSFLSI